MEPISVAEKYSNAMLSIAVEQNSLEQVETELLYVGQVLLEQKELKAFLEAPMVDKEEKKSLLKRIFGDAIGKMPLQFLFVMVDRGREDVIETAIKIFVTQARIRRGIVEANVTVASDIYPQTEEKLKAKLEGLTGKKVILNIRKKPSIVAGMIIQIGDKRIDASITRNLEELRKVLRKEDIYDAENGVNDSV